MTDDEKRTCIICRRNDLAPTEQQTCLNCLAQTRSRLAEIVEIYALLPEQLGHPKSPSLDGAPKAKDDERPLMGGDALSLLAGGSRGMSQVWGIRTPNGGIDRSHEEDEHDGDAPSIAFELSRWEDDWRLTRGEPAATTPATVSGAANYLGGHRMDWAAQHHPAYDEFAQDIRKLLSMLRHVAGMSEKPVNGAAVCTDCEVTLQRRWTDKGLADHWTCSYCRREYTDTEYASAVKTTLDDAQNGPTAGQVLALALGISEGRIRQWATRGYVRRLGKDSRGRMMYDAEEVRAWALRDEAKSA